MELLLTSAFLITWLTASVRLAGPLLLAALGELVGELSGVLNVAIEGLMLIGALTAFMIAFRTQEPWMGVLGAMLVCLIFGLLLAWMYITVQANMAVVGILFNILALGLTSYTYQAFFGSSPAIQQATLFRPIYVPWLSDVPFVGRILFQHSIMLYLTIALVMVTSFALYRTKFGLRLRAAGEHPLAAASAGINVKGVRYLNASA